MKKRLIFWVERYFYAPTPFDRILSVLFLPLTLLYCIIVFLRYKLQYPKDLGIKVVSIGNLSVGGSGKTPLGIAIAKHYGDVAVVLRGYGRQSKGLIVVKDKEKILCDAIKCGDEALVYANKLPDAVIIVSEDRKAGIKKAKEMGVRFVILDDGYSKHDIKKLDILIEVVSKNNFCLPSGPFRERLWNGKNAMIVKEGKDFQRKVSIKNPTQKMVLVSAIARPRRLEPFLPPVLNKYYFEDHYTFSKSDIDRIIHKEKPDSLLVTLKDYVKLQKFEFPLTLLDLEIQINKRIFTEIEVFLHNN